MTTHESIFCWTKGKATCLVCIDVFVCKVLAQLQAPVCAHYINLSLAVYKHISLLVHYLKSSSCAQTSRSLLTGISPVCSLRYRAINGMVAPLSRRSMTLTTKRSCSFTFSDITVPSFHAGSRSSLSAMVWNSETKLKKRHEGGQSVDANTTKNNTCTTIKWTTYFWT